MPGTDHTVPRSSVTAAGKNWPCSHASKKPKRPSRTVGGPVKPRRTSWAAVTPAWAARPQCRRLTVLAVLEEDRVAELLVVPRHAEADGDLEADGDRAHDLLAGGAGVLGRGEGGRDDAGAGVQHRREVGVVVVERVREDAVGEGRLGGGHPRRYADRGRLLVAALVEDVAERGGAGGQPVGGDAEAEHVEHALLDARGDVVGDAVVAGVDREVAELLGEGPVGHLGVPAALFAEERSGGVEERRGVIMRPPRRAGGRASRWRRRGAAARARTGTRGSRPRSE